MLTNCILVEYMGTFRDLDLMTKGEISVFLGFCLSFLFSLLLLPRIFLISKKKRLFDNIDSRKSHIGDIPRLGGLIFVPAILCTLSVSLAFRYSIEFYVNLSLSENVLQEFLFLLSGICFLYLVGAKDDLVGVRYRKKFLAQFLVASLIPLSGLYINNLYGIFNIENIPPYIGMPLTVIMIVYVTNSINLIDGIDGLAAGGCSIAFFVFGILFMSRELFLYSMLSFTALGCLLPFAYYNVFGITKPDRRIFMGDAGSLSLGFLLSFLSIKSIMYVPSYYFSYDVKSILIPISLLFVPCFDVLRVMIVRAIHHKSMFLADRNHIHHKCLGTGMNHLQSTISLLLYTILIVLVNIFTINIMNVNYLIILDILSLMLLISILDRLKKYH